MFKRNFLIADGLHKLQYLFDSGYVTSIELKKFWDKLFQNPKKTNCMIQAIFWWKYLLDTMQIERNEFNSFKQTMLKK